MRALVTGARGFVGKHLVAHLQGCGDYVIEMDRVIDSPCLEDATAIAAYISSAQPEVVYHLAGQSNVAASWTDPVGTFQTNATGTLNLLEACHAAQVHKVLAVSSSDIYGVVSSQDLPITESVPLRPVNPYAASKAAAEMLCLQGFLGNQLPIVRARAFNHLGPGQSEHFLAAALAIRIARNELNGESTVPVGNLSARRDFTDVRDVVRAYRLLIQHGVAGEAYNVCSGNAVAVTEVAQMLLSLTTTQMTLHLDQSLLRPTEVPVLQGDNSKLHACTGWKPEISLAQTLSDVLGDARKRLSEQTS